MYMASFLFPLSLSLSFISIKGGRLVQSAVEERLQMLIPYIDTWPEVCTCTCIISYFNVIKNQIK